MLRIKGSIHKCFNDEKHNYNHFTFSMIAKVLKELENTQDIKLIEAIISNFEVGVNIRPPMDSKALLDSL